MTSAQRVGAKSTPNWGQTVSILWTKGNRKEVKKSKLLVEVTYGCPTSITRIPLRKAEQKTHSASLPFKDGLGRPIPYPDKNSEMSDGRLEMSVVRSCLRLPTLKMGL